MHLTPPDPEQLSGPEAYITAETRAFWDALYGQPMPDWVVPAVAMRYFRETLIPLIHGLDSPSQNGPTPDMNLISENARLRTAINRLSQSMAIMAELVDR